MNQTRPDDQSPTLTCDDPRISEWIDGRLAGCEAEAVARAVAASAELSRFVAELRALKDAAARLPIAPPAHGFVQRVMDAIGTTAVGGGDDAAVEAEWRKLEAERIEEEREEAFDDVAEALPATPPRRWPWVALATSLAAGVLVAAFLNTALVRRHDREVALEAPAVSVESAKPAEVAAPAESVTLAESATPAAVVADAVPASPVPLADDAMPAAARGRSLAAPAPRHSAERAIAIVIDGDRGRAALMRLLEEHGITRRDGADSPATEPSQEKAAASAGESLADERLELAAPAAAIDAFLEALGRSADEGLSIASANAAAKAGADDQVERLVIRILPAGNEP